MTHSAECLAQAKQNEAEIAAWQAAWPNHCKDCHGWGGVCGTYDPSPAGVALGSGSMTDFSTCPDCVDSGRCPRCGEPLEDGTATLAMRTEPPTLHCPSCRWTDEETGGCPHPMECFCWSPPTLPKYPERVSQVLALLCGEAPPADLVRGWLAQEDPTEADDLQDWAANRLRIEWAMGITVIEAATCIASQPNEGLIVRIELETYEATGERLPSGWWEA